MNYRKWYDNFWLGWIGALTLETSFELLPGQSRDSTWPFALGFAFVLAYSVWRSRRNQVVPYSPHACKRGALRPQEGCTQPSIHPLGPDPASLKKDEIP